MRIDLMTFVHGIFPIVEPKGRYDHNWHVEVIADNLTRVATGEIRHLIINLPPRHLKSICASVAFPAWYLGHNPGARIVCISHSGELAGKLSRDCRAVMESPLYRELFPKTRLDRSKCTEMEFMTTDKGFRLATSIGGTLTGRGGNLFIIDDPLKAGDALSDLKRQEVNDWYSNTLYSRLDNKANDRIVIVMQRLHPEDLVGYVLSRDKDWELLSLPAIAESTTRYELGDGRTYVRASGQVLYPQREPIAVLERIRRNLGSSAFSAQYQQNPLPLEGGLLHWNWFQFVETMPKRQPTDRITQSWDTASKANEIHDYSVCTTWLQRGNQHYLLNVIRVHLEYPPLKRLIVEMANRYRPHAVLIEDCGSGTQLIQDLREESKLYAIPIMPEGDKVTRMSVLSPIIESRQVILPEHAPWLDDFQTEILSFPNSRFSDQVDSVSQYLGWVRSRIMPDAPIMFFESEFARSWEREFGPSESIASALPWPGRY